MGDAEVKQLYECIGKLTVENAVLRGQIQNLEQQHAADQEALQLVLAAQNKEPAPPA